MPPTRNGGIGGAIVKKLYAGLDTHKETIYCVVLEKDGTPYRHGNIRYTKESLQNFFVDIPTSCLKIAIESSGLWRGVYKILRDLGYEVVLGDPLKVHQIANRRKTDRGDARILADLLRNDYLPLVYIPDENTMELRDLARHRARLVRLRSMLKCRIKAYLLMEGESYGEIRTKKALEELKGMNPKIANLVRIIEAINAEIRLVSKDVGAISRNGSLSSLLRTIPGVGEFSSLMILGEIGDIKRFKKPKSLVSYAGLCPGVHQSADTCYTVPNKACNKWLKWIMTECSGRAIMMDNRYMRHYYRIKQRRGFKIARRSTGRKMLTDIWYILTKEEPFMDS